MANLVSFLSDLIGIYSFLVIVRVFLSFRRPNMENPQGGFDGIVTLLSRICDPYLNFFKRIFYKGGALDFSPMWALVTLNIIKSILRLLSVTGKLTVGSVITILYSTIWGSVFSYINIILIIVLIIRINLERKIDPRSMQVKDVMDKFLNGIVFKVYNLFYKGKAVTDLRLIQTTLVVFIVLEVLGSALNMILSGIFL